jgi:hypothetical protein
MIPCLERQGGRRAHQVLLARGREGGAEASDAAQAPHVFPPEPWVPTKTVGRSRSCGAQSSAYDETSEVRTLEAKREKSTTRSRR